MNELEPIQKEVNQVALAAHDLYIQKPEDVPVAVLFLQDVAKAKKRIQDFFAPHKKSTYEAWRGLCKQETQILAPLLSAESVVKQRKTEFDMEQRRRAEEEKRKEDERIRKEEEKAKRKLDALIAKTTDEERIAQLEEEKEFLHIPRCAVESAPVKVAGSSTQKDWNIEIVDKAALLRAILTGVHRISLDAIDIKTSSLKQYIKVSGNANIAGCKVMETLIQKIKG